MQINVLAVVPFLVAISFAALAILAWRRTVRKAVRKTLTAFLVVMAAWSLGSALLHADSTPGHSVWWLRLLFALGIVTVLPYYHFVRSYLGRPDLDNWLRLGYILVPLMIADVFFGDVALDAKVVDGAFSATWGPGRDLAWMYYLFFYGLVAYTLAAHRWRARDSALRAALSYLLAGFSVTLLASTTNLIDALAQYPVDQIGNLINAAIIAYVVLRHNLLETTALIRRGALYALISAVTTAFYMGVIVATVTVLNGHMDPTVVAIGFVLALLLGIAFRPLQAGTQRWIDRVFFREEYEYRLLLNECSRVMVGSLELEPLCRGLLAPIGAALHVGGLGLLVSDKNQSGYRLVAGDLRCPQALQFDALHPVVQRMKRSSAPLTKTDILALPQFYSLWQTEREQLSEADFDLLVPLLSEQLLVGILVLGRKRSEQPYTEEETQLLTTIGNQVVVAIDKARLHQELKTSYQELQETQEKLVQAERLKALGEMAAGIAHDFNNLLVPIVAYPELIKMKLSEGHPAVSLCEDMLVAANQLVEMNSDIMALGRRVHAEYRPTDLNGVVRQVAAALGDSPETLRVELDLAPYLPLVRGAKAQLVRLVTNLAVNGRDAMHGEGVLFLKTELFHLDRPPGEHAGLGAGDYVRLSVCDSGCGIPPEIKSRIFEPFFSTKRVSEKRGSGLGLAIVRAIAEDHAGHVELESEVGKGACFHVYLPANREAVHQGSVKGNGPGELQGGSETVLVVDDDPLQRDTVARMLEALGYRAELAVSGAAAVAYLEQHSADLLILDMVMPGEMDGAETYRRVQELRPGQRAIIVSGFAETERVEKALALGAGAFIYKPLSLEKLGSAVREELDREMSQNPSLAGSAP